MAYISIAFTNRNDNYGGDLKARIDKFIDYYSYLVSIDPDLFEFVICDWNPPINAPSQAGAFDWDRLGTVKHVVVPADVHAELAADSNSPMLDYFGRNVAIRAGNAPFFLVLNQDIFMSRCLFDVLRKRNLDQGSFYRADRIDFDFESIADKKAEDIERNALSSSFEIHRRHSSRYDEISVPYSPDTASHVASAPEPGDIVDEADNIILCEAAEKRRHQMLKAQPGTDFFDAMQDDASFYYGFYLHTNASGDFLLVPREGFEKIEGLPERTDFYMHSDSYAVFQLFAAGFQMRIFRHPHQVFHADHERSARAGRLESMAYKEHEVVFSQMIKGQIPYVMNGPNWGLANYELQSHVEKGLNSDG